MLEKQHKFLSVLICVLSWLLVKSLFILTFLWKIRFFYVICRRCLYFPLANKQLTELFFLAADINNNLSDVGFGHVTHNSQYVGFLEYSTSLGIDCYGWGVPLGAGQQPPAWFMFTTEFSSLTWGLIFMSLLVAAVVLWILPRALPRWEQRDSKLYMPR